MVENQFLEQHPICQIDPWCLVETSFSPDTNEVSESLFSLANEYMGTRGNFEEGFDGHSLPGCYIGGIYVKECYSYAWQRLADPTYGNFMINTVNWLDLKVRVGREVFSMSTSCYSDYHRVLDMKTGVLFRSLVFTTQAGEQTRLCWKRFISHNDPHLAAIRLTVQALNHRTTIHVEAALDGRMENKISATSHIHSHTLEYQATESETFLLTHFQTTGQYTMHRMHVTHNIPSVETSFASKEKRISCVLSFIPDLGKEYAIDKLVSVWTSRDAGYPHGVVSKETNQIDVPSETEQKIKEFLIDRSQGHLSRCICEGFDVLYHQHAKTVSMLWDRYDVEIDGDPTAQQGIRYSIFQLSSTYRGGDGFINIGPKGYTGENYNGRTFWDSESYCFPFYLFTNPDAALKLVEYRYNTLPQARAQAKRFQYDGAVYPMMTLDGTEDCPLWEYTLGEIHINTTIVYVIWLYTHITGQKNYLYDKGIEVVIEIARFFANRVAYIPHRGAYGINRVMGPNEYGQCVNNNWYTNFMGKWVLEYATQSIEEIKLNAPEKWSLLAKKISFDEKEVDHWEKVADKIILPFDPTMNVFLENDMFLDLDPFAREQLDRDKDIPIERKWSIEKYQKYQILKQPDVLLGIFLHQHLFSLEQKRNNYRFYEQRCFHGSSLSPCIHSILAAQVNRYHQAYDYYLWAARLDLDNCNANTHEGLHISSMAGSWLNIVCGFGGLMYTDEKLCFRPIIPEAWNKYTFKFVYRDAVIQVTVDQRSVTCRLLSGQAVNVCLYDRNIRITPDPVCIPLTQAFLDRAKPQAVIFDLDGVIVDTAKFHYQAWKQIADEEGIYFDQHINERLKGVSRIDSLNIILERKRREYSPQQIHTMAQRKNDLYVRMLSELAPGDILPGIHDFVIELKQVGMKLAICSASKNTQLILKHLKIEDWFDVVITGEHVTQSKPDPEGLLLAAQRLGVESRNCVVVEDSLAGLKAADLAGMKTIGIGDKTLLYNSDYVLPETKYLRWKVVQMLF
jgi:alpha,alpha-trehalose phosphorylase